MKSGKSQNKYLVIMCAALFALGGCRSGEQVNSTNVSSTPATVEKAANEPVANSYEKNGISFVLRRNWKVTEDENIGSGARYLNVEDDQNATLALTFLPTGTNPDLKKYAADFITAMQSNLAGDKLTENGETEVTRSAAGIEKKGVARKYTVTVAGVGVPHTAEFFLIGGRKYDCVAIYNVSDEDKTASDAGFETILYTISAK